MTFEVAQPILNSPYDEPKRHWFIPEGAPPEERAGRRPPFVFQPRQGELTWDVEDGTLARLPEYQGATWHYRIAFQPQDTAQYLSELAPDSPAVLSG